MDDVIILQSATYTKNAYGVDVKSISEKQVYCRYESITRAEFFAGGRQGLNPAFVFTIFAGDYNGEETVVFRGDSYSVYRTYRGPGTDDLELYVRREGGTNGAAL